MTFLVEVAWSIVSVASQFMANQMGFGQVFDNLTFKRMTALNPLNKNISEANTGGDSSITGFMSSELLRAFKSS